MIPQPLPGRVKAASLYIVIVIAMVVALICESLIATAYYFRAYHAFRDRKEQLENYSASGLNLLLGAADTAYYENRSVQLFSLPGDTIRTSKLFWGGFDLGLSVASKGTDTAANVILIGTHPDSSKFFAIWLADEDRPLSVSGRTIIKGRLSLPRAGIRTAYINGHSYEGDKALLERKHQTSPRTLPRPDSGRIKKIDQLFFSATGTTLPEAGSVTASFTKPVRNYTIAGHSMLSGKFLKGHIILRCDSTLTIDSTVGLQDVLVFAKAIIVKPGFKGRCQLFARDSVSIGERCVFTYPSVIAVLHQSPAKAMDQALIRFGAGCEFAGILSAREDKSGDYPAAVLLGRQGQYSGQICGDLIGLAEGTHISGSLVCRRFLYQDGFTRYENYLIDAQVNATSLSQFLQRFRHFSGSRKRP